MFEGLGMLCMVIDRSGGALNGIMRMQDTLYFASRLGWDAGRFVYDCHGPCSDEVTRLVDMGRSCGMIEATGDAERSYRLTAKGSAYLEEFLKRLGDDARVGATGSLVGYLSGWSEDDLEIAASLDFVDVISPELGEAAVMEKVISTSERFDAGPIRAAFGKWIDLKAELARLAASKPVPAAGIRA